MADESIKSSKRVLDPIDRVSEVLFGLIMVLGFTGSLSVADAGRDDVRAMLVGALGCNLAWGIIDGLLYLMGCLAEKSRNLSTLVAVRGAQDAARARELLAGALLPFIASAMQPAELDAVSARLAQLPAPPKHASLARADWLGAIAVCLLVFLSTLPVVIPFIVMRSALPAMRVSNGIAIALLFVTGYAYARQTGHHAVWMGCGMVVLGAALVGLTMALGG